MVLVLTVVLVRLISYGCAVLLSLLSGPPQWSVVLLRLISYGCAVLLSLLSSTFGFLLMDLESPEILAYFPVFADVFCVCSEPEDIILLNLRRAIFKRIQMKVNACISEKINVAKKQIYISFFFNLFLLIRQTCWHTTVLHKMKS